MPTRITGKFLLQQMAAVAELEAGTISALAAAKRRGVKLRGDRGARLTVKARAAGRVHDLAPAIQELQAAGCELLRAIAAGLEESGIPAARGGKCSAVRSLGCWRRPPSLSTRSPPSQSREKS